MVNITKVYTRTGDDGTTHLGDMSRTSKTDPRLEAYADTNEANAVVGMVLATGELDEEATATLTRIQNDLFDVGADLCMPLRSSYDWEPLRVKQQWIDELEEDCDYFNEQVENLRSFILPGGSPASASLHLATTITRRAERRVWAAIETYGDQPAPEGAERGEGGVSVLAAKYLNRLSDLLFILARVANVPRGGDVLWQPGGGRADIPEKRRRTPKKAQESAAEKAQESGAAGDEAQTR